MEDLVTGSKGNHKLVMSLRKTCNLTGIVDAISFDPGEILLETEMGMLMIRGNDLHVKRIMLEKGEVDVEGKIDSLTYSNDSGIAAKGESLLGRLFK